MRAELRGEGGTGLPLVFLPGMDGTGELLLTTAERLESDFRLLRFRYVGDGQPGSATTYERLADTAAECLTRAGIGRTLILAESFGGGVALQFALRHPERVRGLALVNTFAWFPRRARLGLGALLFPWIPKSMVRLGRNLTARQVFFRPRRDPAAETAFMERAVGFEDESFEARMVAIRHLDLRERLGEISARCHLYASSHDRVVPSQTTMATLAAGLPNATLELIPRANHIVLPLAEEPWPERFRSLARETE